MERFAELVNAFMTLTIFMKVVSYIWLDSEYDPDPNSQAQI